MKTIGITCSRTDEYRSGISREYSEAVIRAGALPFLLPVTTDERAIREQVSRMDGVLLSGGYDIAPSYYGQQPHRNLGKVDGMRDEYEMKILDAAMAQKKPVLGICRGIQLMKVYFWGTLLQDVLSAGPKIFGHDQTCERYLPSHEIEVEPGSWLEKIFGRRAMVNSFHHQAVDAVAPGFCVTARAGDGIIEAMEDPARKCYAVQFHPEMMAEKDSKAQAVFDAFAAML